MYAIYVYIKYEYYYFKRKKFSAKKLQKMKNMCHMFRL